jgi:hypothetical protein
MVPSTNLYCISRTWPSSVFVCLPPKTRDNESDLPPGASVCSVGSQVESVFQSKELVFPWRQSEPKGTFPPLELGLWSNSVWRPYVSLLHHKRRGKWNCLGIVRSRKWRNSFSSTSKSVWLWSKY